MSLERDILDARILIVDDQDANVQLLGRLLAEAGYTRVTSTALPTEVCTLHRRETYDLILLDLQMPVMDGFAVMEALKAVSDGSYLPVIVLTAQPGHKLRALQAGAKDFITSPSTWSRSRPASTTCSRCACCTGRSKRTHGCWSRRWPSAPPSCARARRVSAR